MNIFSWLNPANLIGKGIDAISGYQVKKKEKEIIKIRAQAKLDQAREQGNQDVTLTDAEWESIAVSKSDSTWKDEYVTIVFTAPIVVLLFGSMASSYGTDISLVDATLEGVRALKELGIDFGTTTYAIVLAAIGLKVWRANK